MQLHCFHTYFGRVAVIAFAIFLSTLSVISSQSTPGPTPDTSKPWTRWWWPGSAVSEAGITQQLEQLADAGIGGVEITPIYGARGYENDYIEFLSPEWMQMLDYVGKEAQRLGLGVDMATGTGWPFGGPWVPVDDGALKIVFQEGHIAGVPTEQQVKRAAPGGEGWVINPYNSDALHRYLAKFDEVFKSFPVECIRSQFHDSFEYYGASWTDAFEQKFTEMHGYDLQNYAAELMDLKSMPEEELARLKGDFRATLSELHLDYLKSWNAWAHTHGQLTRNQSHGAPANLLDLYAAADIPETEIFGASPFPIPGLRYDPTAVRRRNTHDLPEPLVTRFASSAAHISGKPLVSCESATWLRDHWKVTLAYVKPELDRVMLDGINHIFYHGTVYSPPPGQVPWPGWLFYASTQFNPNNPWWQDFSQLNTYIQRVQSVLQSGQPDNDVLLYWPEADVWHNAAPNDKRNGPMIQLSVHGVDWIMHAACGKAAKTLHDHGYAFDYISDKQVLDCRVEGDGAIVTSGGNHYRTIIIPATHYMPIATMQQLLRYANAGANIIFEKLPEDVPGLKEVENRQKTLASLNKQIQELPNCYLAHDLLQGLQQLGVRSENMMALGLDCIRRQTDGGVSYFIVNLSGNPVDAWLPIATTFESVELVDPLSGETGLARTHVESNEVYLQLSPGQSILLHARKHPSSLTEQWQYFTRNTSDAQSLKGSWKVEFINGGPEIPHSFTTEAYGSWTDLCPDPEAKRFAGTARYTLEFTISEGTSADDFMLDLGDLRESARVTLNGTNIGTVWSLPFQIRLGKALKKGRNLLELEITNTAANRIRDMDVQGVDWKIMHEINFVDVNYRPFDATDWPIESAGLLTPVELIPLHKLDLE